MSSSIVSLLLLYCLSDPTACWESDYCNDWMSIQAVFNCLLKWSSFVYLCSIVNSFSSQLLRFDVALRKDLYNKVKEWQFCNHFSWWTCRINLAIIQSWYCSVCQEDKEVGNAWLCSHNRLHATVYCRIHCPGPTTMGSALQIHSSEGWPRDGEERKWPGIDHPLVNMCIVSMQVFCTYARGQDGHQSVAMHLGHWAEWY